MKRLALFILTGANHDPNNRGAFSHYWHRDSWHHSIVVRHSDAHSNTKSANARHTSKAFINTSFGENVSFYKGT